MKVPKYELSLDPRGELRFVKPVDNPKMMGPVTDLYTFYFAISPVAGSTKVNKPGDIYVRSDFVTGDWSDGREIIVGQDQTQVRLKLLSLVPPEVIYETSFLPPGKPTLEFKHPWMRDRVCEESPNNFQMIRRQGSGFLVVWGCEEFTVRSIVEMSSGKIRSAHMDNRLRWKVKVCQDEAPTTCTDLPNVDRHRSVDLSLLQ